LRPLRSLRLNPLIRIRPFFYSSWSPGEKKLFCDLCLIIVESFHGQQLISGSGARSAPYETFASFAFFAAKPTCPNSPLFILPRRDGGEKTFVIFVPFVVNCRPSFPAYFLAEKTAPIVGDFVLQLAAGAANFGKLLAPLVGACRVDHGA
jgi:hypothetical protein